MAQGDLKTFNDYPFKAGKKQYDNVNDSFKYALITDTYASVDIDITDPVLTSFTESAGGGNYTSGGNALAGVAWTRASTITKLDFTDISLLKNASNPITAKVMLIDNFTAGDDCYFAIDLTSDGSTAIDLVNNDLTVTFNANGLVNITVTA